MRKFESRSGNSMIMSSSPYQISLETQEPGNPRVIYSNIPLGAKGPATDHLDTGLLSRFPCVLKANAEVVPKYPRCH